NMKHNTPSKRKSQVRRTAASVPLLSLLMLLLTGCGTVKVQTPDAGYDLYLARISTAEALLQLNKISEARRYLDACPQQYRDVEWQFLNAFLDQSASTIKLPEGQTYTAVAMSPDGKTLAAAGSDSSIVLYNWPGLTPQGQLNGHKTAVSTLAFSNSGKQLASGGRDHAVILWDLSSRKAVWNNNKAFSRGIYQVRFSPDDRSIGVVSWELRPISPNVMGFGKILDAATGAEQIKIETEPHPAAGILFTDNGNRIIISCWGEVVTAYNRSTGDPIWTYDLSDPEEYNAFHSVDLSPDGRSILLGSTDHRLHLLDSETGRLLRRIEPWEGHTKTIKAVAYTPDGKRFASAGEDQTIQVWDAETHQKLFSLIGHTAAVAGLCWSKDGDTLISAALDGALKTWDLSKPFSTTYEVCDYGPWQAPVTSDRQTFAAACSDEKLTLYNIRTGRPQKDLGPFKSISADMSRDNRHLVTAGFDGIVRLWNLGNGLQEKTFEGHTTRVDGVAYLNSTGQVISVGDTTLRVWNPDSASPATIIPLDKRPFRVVLTPDEHNAIIGFGDGNIRIYSTDNWKETARFKCEADLNEMAVSPDGKLLAVFSGKNIEVWKIATRELHYLLRGHDQTGYGVGFSPDSRYVISGSYDQTFRLWNLSTGQCTLAFHGYEDNIYTTRFLNGYELLLGTAEGKMFYYNFQPPHLPPT
ncbi:MAG TPA: PQQ-binding-like beta-propeller repeat protein, partial [Flavilitoribacter sp.]|nr:PQQ-binding-like beta-propeller repeat protein [Flavilitoribacter sp.]